MYKLVWTIVGFCVFLGVTLGALTAQNLNYGKPVNFVNVNLAVRNSSNQVINKTVTVPGQVITQNSTLTTTATSGDAKNYNSTTSTSVNMDRNTVTYEKEYSTQTSSRTDKYSKKYQYDKTPISYKNIDDSDLDNILKNATTTTKTSKKEQLSQIPKYKSANNSKEYQYPDDVEYGYDNIDWSRWKSNFVNKILDDSMILTELDKYPSGAFFYYSFVVDYEGNISNISVRSIYLSDEDKKIVSNFIKQYAHKPITKFPPKTNRKTARVSAIMMLSSTETVHSKPSDFNDTEKIKYQINR